MTLLAAMMFWLAAADTPPGAVVQAPRRAVMAAHASPPDAETVAFAQALSARLETGWRPDCSGRTDIAISVSFRVDATGHLAGAPVSSARDSTDRETKALSDRAVGVIEAAEPFNDFPASLTGKRFVVRFNKAAACHATH